jgi:hypothetical protein
MQIFIDAHYALGQCNTRMFYTQEDVEECQRVWGIIEALIAKDRDGTLLSLYQSKSEIQHSVKFLALMFGKGDLLKPPVEAQA